MALFNLLNLRETILKRNGTVNRGGTIDVFEPGTAVRITTYEDSALTNENANPVVLSAGGQANIWIARNCDMDVYDVDGNIISSEQSVNPDQLGVSEASGLVPNGSFEIDTDSNDEPDGWTRTDEAGSTNTLDITQSTDGAQSMQFISVGNGGGDIVTDEFFVVNDVDDLSVHFDIKSSVVDVRNIVRIEWYDSDQITISNDDVYDNATTNPLVFTEQQTITTPPANARFAKLRLIGCSPLDATPGNTNFDRVSAFYPLVVDGQFDNIKIQNNEIISTNVNGNVEINPNGTGEFQAKFNALVRILADANAVRMNSDLTGVIARLINEGPPGFDASFTQFADNGGHILVIDEVAGVTEFRQTSNVGAIEDNIWQHTRNGAWRVYDNGLLVGRTLTSPLGSFEINNSLTGVGFRRVLTEGDALTDVLLSDFAVPAVTFVTPLAIQVEASRQYAITGFIMLDVPDAGDDSSWRWNGPAGATGEIQFSGIDQVGATTKRTPIGGLFLSNDDGTVVPTSYALSGYIIVAGTPGDLIIEIAKQLDVGGDAQVLQGSWIKCVPVQVAP